MTKPHGFQNVFAIIHGQIQMYTKITSGIYVAYFNLSATKSGGWLISYLRP